MSDCTPSCGHWAEIEELKRLRALITAYADADEDMDERWDLAAQDAYTDALTALRKAVGR